MTRSSAERFYKCTPVNSHFLSNEAVGNPLNDFHRLLRQFQSSIVASVQSITLFLVKADSETLLPVSWNLPISRDKALSTMMKISEFLTSPNTAPQILVHSLNSEQVSQIIPQHQSFSLPTRTLSEELGRTHCLF